MVDNAEIGASSPKYSAVAAVCVMLVGASAIECFMRLLLQSGNGNLRGIAIRFIGWAFIPVCALAVRYTKPLERWSAPIALASCGLLYCAITMFRGAWVWYG